MLALQLYFFSVLFSLFSLLSARGGAVRAEGGKEEGRREGQWCCIPIGTVTSLAYAMQLIPTVSRVIVDI